MNEEKLVILLKAHERRAFAHLYDQYGAALYGVILRVVKAPEVAQEVLQDSFVKIWKNMDSYDPAKGSLFTWILQIARNTAIDKIRSKEYKESVLTNPIALNHSDAQKVIRSPVEYTGLESIVENLKPTLREIIDLIYFQGYTHVEAAEALALPLGTVKTRVKIAIRELRKLISN
ncbi:MAG: sigma-70 family RNA polymerase sigma factor [Bacteroidia bacterium]|nr:sigma-70 family RNA polymerase sigma factor [Bacteroidia bacterium]